MFPGFEKIVEERIRKAQRQGQFDNLPGVGRPLVFADDRHIPEDLRLAYKVLKNSDCLPPELELKKEIHRTEELLADMQDVEQRYRTVKKLNLLILRFNALRKGTAELDLPQKYEHRVADRLGARRQGGQGG